MTHDFQYISKRDPQVKKAHGDLMKLLHEVQEQLRSELTFRYKVVGSYARNMITFDAKSNVGFDFDVNIYLSDDSENLKAKELKLKFKGALDRFCGSYGFSPAEDSTRVLTIKVKDRKHSRIVYSVDFAIVNDYLDEDNQPCQEYIRFDKKRNRYTWEEQPNGYYELPEKIEWVKEHDLWHRVRELYIEKKNSNTDPNVHSRSIFANTVHQVCQQNGYFDD